MIDTHNTCAGFLAEHPSKASSPEIGHRLALLERQFVRCKTRGNMGTVSWVRSWFSKGTLFRSSCQQGSLEFTLKHHPKETHLKRHNRVMFRTSNMGNTVDTQILQVVSLATCTESTFSGLCRTPTKMGNYTISWASTKYVTNVICVKGGPTKWRSFSLPSKATPKSSESRLTHSAPASICVLSPPKKTNRHYFQ